MESSIQSLPPQNIANGANDPRGNISEKFCQMKSLFEDLTSNYSIPTALTFPPIEITISNMESYVGKPKYLNDRYSTD